MKGLFNIKKIKTIQPDPFISRLRSTVIGEGMLDEGNIYLMDYAIKNMPPNGSVIEIGSHGGLSTNLILHLMKKYGIKQSFFGCDAWVYEGYHDYKGNVEMHMEGNKDVSRVNYTTYIKNAFINATLLLSKDNLPATIHTSSNCFFELWNNNSNATDVFDRTIKLGGSIGFAYIDGNHSLEQARKDFENVNFSLLKNGVVLIDDSADGKNFGSAHFAKTIARKSTSYKVVCKNPNYLFQKI